MSTPSPVMSKSSGYKQLWACFLLGWFVLFFCYTTNGRPCKNKAWNRECLPARLHILGDPGRTGGQLGAVTTVKCSDESCGAKWLPRRSADSSCWSWCYHTALTRQTWKLHLKGISTIALGSLSHVRAQTRHTYQKKFGSAIVLVSNEKQSNLFCVILCNAENNIL